MSRGRLVRFLFLITLASGLMMSVAGSVEAQTTTTDTFILHGKVTDNEGVALEGYTVLAPLEASDLATVVKTGPAGEYKIVYSALFASAVIGVGDTIEITVKAPDGQDVARKSYTVTQADIDREPLAGVEINIQLSGLTAELDPSQLPADGVSTTMITVSVQSGGAPVTDDTVTITAEQGSVGEVTNNGDGTYTAMYTAPALVLTTSTKDTITVNSGTTGDTTTASVTLDVVRTDISVLVIPDVFIAGTAATGAVQISASRGPDAVADADISLGLRRADGGADTGTVTGVTSNGDGTYSATYTAPNTAGQINITATDAVSGASGMDLVTVNAGAAATVAVSAAPMTVSSGGSALITAMVMDASGNGVGGLTLSGSAESGTVGEFSAAAPVGSYRATYTAGMVDAEGMDTVTVSVGNVSGQVTISLTPVPPKEVQILVVSGTIFKQDGTGAVAGVNVEVMVGDMAPRSMQSGSNGYYNVTFLNPGGVAGRTGDMVSVVVTDDAGVERGRDESVLTSEELGDDNEATVVRDVTTDILARTNALVVSGSVFHVESEIPIDDVFEITVMNTTRDTEMSGMTDGNGMYRLTFFDPTTVVAETGDELVATASKDGGEWSSPVYSLSSDEVEGGSATVNVPTNIKASSNALVVTGTVYFEDGTVAVGAGVTVTATNAGRGLRQTGTTDAGGMYRVDFFGTEGFVAETADIISVSAVHFDMGDGTADYALTSDDVDAQRAEVNVITTVKAFTSSLLVTGTVFYEGSMIPVGAGNSVTVLNNANEREASSMTDASGRYSATLFDPVETVAETGDMLTVTVTSEEDGSGSIDYSLTAMDIDAQRANVDVPTNIKATSPTFLVTGTVFLEDGISGAPAGLTVKVMNETQGVNAEGVTLADGGYSATFLETAAAAVKTADVLEFDVLVMADDETPVGEDSITLTSADVVGQRKDGVDITTTLTAPPTNTFLIDGTVRNPAGNIVGEGVEVRVTLGDLHDTRHLVTDANGRYRTTYFDPAATVASVYDAVVIQAVDYRNGDSAYMSMELASHHVIAQRLMIDVNLVPDKEAPEARAKVEQRFLDTNEITTFDARESTDTPLNSQLIDTFVWDFGDGTSGSGDVTKHAYSEPGRYDVTLTVTDLAGNFDEAYLEIYVSTVRLGGISLNTVHAREVLDKIISLAIAQTDAAQQAGGAEQLLAMMRANPAIQKAVMDALSEILPPGFIPAQLLKADLPLIFEQYENTDLENFGNAITVIPGASEGFLDSATPGFGRVVTGEKLDLYLATPRADVGHVTFRFNGVTRDADEVIDSLTHRFQLEEEQAIFFLPSWPGSGRDGAFSAVTLMLASEELPEAYHNLISRNAWSYRETSDYQPMPLEPKMINGKRVWDAEINIEPGKIYYYYYVVDLAYPVKVQLGGNQGSMDLMQYAMPDPRNLQLQDRGLVEALFTPEFQAAIAPLLNPIIAGILRGQAVTPDDVIESLTPETALELFGAILNAVGGLYEEVVQTMDPRMISVFTVPLVNEAQSLWHTSIDLSGYADEIHTIDANAFDSMGIQIDNRPVFGKTFMLDRAAPAYSVAAAPGQNSSMYMRDDGVLIATGLPPFGEGSPMATLLLTASPNGDVSDVVEGLYQIIRHKDDPAEQASQTWVNILTSDMAPMFQGITLDDFTAFLQTFPNLLTLNTPAINVGVPEMMQMLIRGANGDPGLIVGEYGLRVIARDPVFNMSTDTAPIRLNIVPPDPDQAMIVQISLGDCNGDGDTDDRYETGTPDEMILFSDTPNVMLTAEITKQVHPITSILFQYRTGEGEWQDIGTLEGEMVAGAAVGSQYDVAWSIDNLGAMIQADMPVMLRAVVTNALSISDDEAAEAALAVKDHPCPIEPEVHELSHGVTDRNPDSNAPRGMIMLQAITRELTSPHMTSLIFEVRRTQSDEWQAVGEVPIADSVVEDAILEGLEEALEEVVGGEESAVIVPTRRVWSFELDSSTLEDTIMVGDAAERDVNLDENPYVLRAVAVDDTGARYESAEELSQSFSVDNIDDVPPVTGTAILEIADAAGAIEKDDAGVYTVGGIVHESVDKPFALVMSMPIADPKTYDRVDVLINLRNEDGSLGDAVREMQAEMGAENYTVTIDVSTLENGAYFFQALAMDEVGNQEVRDIAFAAMIDVANFIPPPEIDLSGQTLSRQPVEEVTVEEFTEAYPGGFPISGDYVFTAGGIALNAGDIDVLVDGGSANEMGALTVTTVEEGASSTFMLTLDTTMYELGYHELALQITKRNGRISFPLAPLFIDNEAPQLAVTSPIANDEVSALPTMHAAYNDGAGAGIELSFVTISLVRLTPPDTTAVEIVASQVLTDLTDLVYTRREMLPAGVYRVMVTVTDIVDNTSEASADFTVVTTLPSVSILSPMPGQILDVSSPYISAVFTGIGASVTSFTLDGTDIEDATISGNRVEYTPDALPDGDHTVAIAIMDAEGNAMDDSVKFTIRTADTTPPLITAASPQGIVKSASAMLSIAASDEESGVASVSYAIDGGEAVDGMTREVSDLSPGTHTVMAVATNGAGLQSTFSWTFTVELDTTPPVISEVAPQGIVKSAAATLSATVTDEQSAVSNVTIALDGGDAEAVEVDGGGVSRDVSDLTPGTHSVTVVATSSGGSSKHTWTFTVELDTTPPVISTAAPQGIVKVASPEISAAIGDEQSDITNVTIAIDGRAAQAVALEDGRVSRAARGLSSGTHTVTVAATSAGGTSTHTWTFTVELDTTPPVISAVAPQGIIKEASTTISAAVGDEQSRVTRVTIAVDGAGPRVAILRDGRASRVVSGLSSGTHNVTVSATSAGGTSTHSWRFTVELDTTPPVISAVSPQGIIREDSAEISAAIGDEQSDITRVTIAVDGGAAAVAALRSGRASRTVTGLESGTHTVTVAATSGGGTSTHSWTFTADLDTTPPEVSATSPHGTVIIEKPEVSVAASDNRGGPLAIEISVKDSEGKDVSGDVAASDDATSATFVPSEGLMAGTYSVNANVKDESGNESSASWSFAVVFDQVPPVITVVAPQGESRVGEERRPIITAHYSDNAAGVDVDSVVLMLDGNAVVPTAVSANQVVYTPPADLPFGRHTVQVEVSDLATPTANTATHVWSFVLEDGKGPIFRGVLRNYPNPFTDNTTVSFNLAREATLTIEIYDISGRLVKVLAQDEVREAGVNEFPWDGKTSAGDVLARGMYFAQIMVTSEPEPVVAVIKMALLRQ